MEQICNHLPPGASTSFYRTAAGAELDVVVQTGRQTLGFEIKFLSAPKVTKGFWQACDDIRVDQAFVLAPVQVISPLDIPAQLYAYLAPHM